MNIFKVIILFIFKSCFAISLFMLNGCSLFDDDKAKLSGTVAQGLVQDANITVYRADNNALIGSTTTGLNGAYALEITDYTGVIKVVSTGGQYKDEITNEMLNVKDPIVAISYISKDNTQTSTNVTPLTHIASKLLLQNNTLANLDPVQIEETNKQVAKALLGVEFDPTQIVPKILDQNATGSDKISGTDGFAGKYGIMLAIISKIAQSNPANVKTVLESIFIDLKSDGIINTTDAQIKLALQDTAIQSGTTDEARDDIDAWISTTDYDTDANVTGDTNVTDQTLGEYTTFTLTITDINKSIPISINNQAIASFTINDQKSYYATNNAIIKIKVLNSNTQNTTNTVIISIGSKKIKLSTTTSVQITSSLPSDYNAIVSQTVSYDIKPYFNDKSSYVLNFKIQDGILPTGIAFNNGIFSGTSVSLNTDGTALKIRVTNTKNNYIDVNLLFKTLTSASSSQTSSNLDPIQNQPIPNKQWKYDGDANWTTDGYIIQSGNIDEEQYSCIEYKSDIIRQISFDQLTSSEKDYSFLNFYINNQLIEKISGDSSWSTIDKILPIGIYDLRWCYVKYKTATRHNQDSVYIKNIKTTTIDKVFSINEDKQIGTNLGIIDFDGKQNNQIYKIVSNNDDTFRILNNGMVVLNKKLDFETKNIYTYAIETTNANSQIKKLYIAIKVTDIYTNDMYIKSAVYDNNQTSDTKDDKLYIYFDRAINKTTINNNLGLNFDIDNSGAIGDKSTYTYDDTFYKLTIYLNNNGTASIPFDLQNSTIRIKSNQLKDIFGNYPKDDTQTNIKMINTLARLKTGQAQNSSVVANDDGDTQRGIKHNYTRLNSINTVIDNVTKLMWEDTLHTDHLTPKLQYYKSTKYCKQLKIGGYTNWRLPTSDELVSIMDRKKTQRLTYLDPIFRNDGGTYFLASSPNPHAMWIVEFSEGSEFFLSRYKGSELRCVRDTYSSNIMAQKYFVRDNIHNVILDTSSNLMWQDQPYNQNEQEAYKNNQEFGKTLKLKNGINYCESLTLGGFNDWHLPNYNELHSILKLTNKQTAIISDKFQNTLPFAYISSTILYKKSAIIDFGMSSSGYEINENSHYTRCVRIAK